MWLGLLRKLFTNGVFSCRECGPFVAVDEDGCCITCGAEAKVVKFETAVRRYRRRALV